MAFALVSISAMSPSFQARRWSCQIPNATKTAAATAVKMAGQMRLVRRGDMRLIFEASLFRLVAILQGDEYPFEGAQQNKANNQRQRQEYHEMDPKRRLINEFRP